jgi:four helix bundle protein
MSFPIDPAILETIRLLQPAIQTILRHDPALGQRLKRAASGIALNVSEGSRSRGHHRAVRYHWAKGSARETLACLEVAAGLGYAEVDPGMRDKLERIVGTLLRAA